LPLHDESTGAINKHAINAYIVFKANGLICLSVILGC
jgi:hypothetical protein